MAEIIGQGHGGVTGGVDGNRHGIDDAWARVGIEVVGPGCPGGREGIAGPDARVCPVEVPVNGYRLAQVRSGEPDLEMVEAGAPSTMVENVNGPPHAPVD